MNKKWILIKREYDQELRIVRISFAKGKEVFQSSEGYKWAGPWNTRKELFKHLDNAPSDESIGWKD